MREPPALAGGVCVRTGGRGEKRILGASQGRSATARGGVAGFFSRKRPVTAQYYLFAPFAVWRNPLLSGTTILRRSRVVSSYQQARREAPRGRCTGRRKAVLGSLRTLATLCRFLEAGAAEQTAPISFSSIFAFRRRGGGRSRTQNAKKFLGLPARVLRAPRRLSAQSERTLLVRITTHAARAQSVSVGAKIGSSGAVYSHIVELRLQKGRNARSPQASVRAFCPVVPRRIRSAAAF
jgi:hypothetical protein